jgi:hypothetical protein
MIRKTTVAALVLSAVPAALALSLFSGTAQADDDTPWSHGITVTGDALAGNAVMAGDDTPWARHRDDTPWSRGIDTSDDTPWS